MSEGDGSATDEKSPKPKKRKKKKRRRMDPEDQALVTVFNPAGAAADAVADLVPKTPLFAPQRIVIAGAVAIGIGLGLVGTEPSDLGRGLWIGGLLLLVVGIHLLGRLGPDLGPR